MAQGPESFTGHKLFIGDLPVDITAEELMSVFTNYGKVNNVHMLPHREGSNRCALLFYEDQKSGDDAIQLLNGTYKIRQDAERAIRVSWAKSKDAPPAAGQQPGGAQAASDPLGFKMFVGALPVDITEEELRGLFSAFGTINKVHVMPPSKPPNPRVAAFVYFANAQEGEDASAALNDKYRPREVCEGPIVVRWASARPAGGKGGAGGCGGAGWNDWSSDWNGGGMGKGMGNMNWNNGGWNDWNSGFGGGKGGAYVDNACGKGGNFSNPQQAVRVSEGYKVFAGGLPADTNEEELRGVFGTYGEVTKIHIMQPNSQGKVAAFVFYAAQQGAEDAIKVLNNQYKIRMDSLEAIQVRWGTDKKGGEGGKGSWGQGAGMQALPGCGGGQQWGDQSWGGQKGGYGQQQSWQQPQQNWQQQSWNQQANGNWPSASGKGGWGGGAQDTPQQFDQQQQPAWQQQAPPQGGGQMQNGSQEPIPENKLFVGNLPSDINEESMRYVFGNYGTVTCVHIMTGKSRSGSACAFVEYGSALEASTAMATLNDNYEIKPGCGMIVVKKANPRAKPY